MARVKERGGVGKALDNNDLNQVWLTSGFVKTRVGWGCSVSQAHETWSRPFLFKDFRGVEKKVGYP